jgi:hypothetical protein
MTPRFIASAALTAFLLAASVQADEPLKSGPPVGAKNNRKGFRPQFVAGPSTGQTLCPV